MPGNKNSGRKKKIEPIYKFPIIESFAVKSDEHFGSQLKKLRISKGATLSDIGNRMGSNASNIFHFENPKASHYTGNLNGVIKYAKAMNIKHLIIEL